MPETDYTYATQIDQRLLNGTYPDLYSFVIPKDPANVQIPISVGDGNSHPISTYVGPGNTWANLAAAQVSYPHILSLTDELAWAAAQAAINSLGAVGGGTFTFPMGRYLFNRELINPFDNLRITGVGRKTVIQASANSIALVRICGSDGGLDFLTLDGSYAKTDLVIGTPNTHITSASNPFVAANIGNTFTISGGTGFTLQAVTITSVSSGVATCSAALGTIGSTGGTAQGFFSGVSGVRFGPASETQTTILTQNNFNQSYGVKIVYCAEGLVMVPGPHVGAVDSGCFYNDFYSWHIQHCTRGLWMKDGVGNATQVNRNRFFGLRIGQTGCNTGVQIDNGATNEFHSFAPEGIQELTSPNTIPTAVIIKLASPATGFNNDQNVFFGFKAEANTRDLYSGNDSTEIYGQVVTNGKVVAEVNGATVLDGGSGYTTVPTVTGSGGGGTGATFTATIDVPSGQVISVTGTRGANYTSPPDLAFSGGGGSGAKAVTKLSMPKVMMHGDPSSVPMIIPGLVYPEGSYGSMPSAYNLDSVPLNLRKQQNNALTVGGSLAGSTGLSTIATFKSPNINWGPAITAVCDAGERGIYVLDQNFDLPGNLGNALFINAGGIFTTKQGTLASTAIRLGNPVAAGNIGAFQIEGLPVAGVAARLTYGTSNTGAEFQISKQSGGTVTKMLGILDNGIVNIPGALNIGDGTTGDINRPDNAGAALRIAIGLTTSYQALLLGSGSGGTGGPPFRFTAAALATTPLAASFEYNSVDNKFYFTDGTGRKPLGSGSVLSGNGSPETVVSSLFAGIYEQQDNGSTDTNVWIKGDSIIPGDLVRGWQKRNWFNTIDLNPKLAINLGITVSRAGATRFSVDGDGNIASAGALQLDSIGATLGAIQRPDNAGAQIQVGNGFTKTYGKFTFRNSGGSTTIAEIADTTGQMTLLGPVLPSGIASITRGDLIVGSTATAQAVVAVGTDGLPLVADSTVSATGLTYKRLPALSIAAGTVTDTEFGYVHLVTSAIQTQIDAATARLTALESGTTFVLKTAYDAHVHTGSTGVLSVTGGGSGADPQGGTVSVSITGNAASNTFTTSVHT